MITWAEPRGEWVPPGLSVFSFEFWVYLLSSFFFDFLNVFHFMVGLVKKWSTKFFNKDCIKFAEKNGAISLKNCCALALL